MIPLRPAGDAAVAAELVALQRASYAVEAELIGSDAIPGLHDTPATLVAAGLTWFGVRDGDGLLGAVAIDDGPVLDVDRLVVAPRAFRRGVGTALLRHVLDLADGRPVTVATGRANLPARALYTPARVRRDGRGRDRTGPLDDSINYSQSCSAALERRNIVVPPC